MNAQTEMTPTAEQALEALDSLDDYARMDTGVDAIGPREVLQKFIAAHLTKPDAGGGEVPDLVGFATEIMRGWPEGGIDGFELQDTAEKYGLLVAEIRHEPCGESCGSCPCLDACNEEDFKRGVTCYRRQPLVAPPSDVPAEPSAVPMPEPIVDEFWDDQPTASKYTEQQLKAYADARVAEATRELVDGLRECRNELAERFDLESPSTNPGIKFTVKSTDALIAKYTQTQKESK